MPALRPCLWPCVRPALNNSSHSAIPLGAVRTWVSYIISILSCVKR